MTPAELNSKPQISTEHWWIDAVLLRCIDVDQWGINYARLGTQTRLAVKAHGYRRVDFRRYAILASLWFDDKPFAIVQSAGREGDDHVRVYVTDPQLKLCAEAYVINELSNTPSLPEAVPLDVDIPDLGKFYGNDFFPNY